VSEDTFTAGDRVCYRDPISERIHFGTVTTDDARPTSDRRWIGVWWDTMVNDHERDFWPEELTLVPQPKEWPHMQRPTIGRIVIYRSRTGDYDVPAVVNCTQETLSPKGVEAGHVPDLTSDTHVHLTVLTPGQQGLREQAEDFKVESPHGRSENQGGCYQEWDIPLDLPTPAQGEEWDPQPGTWRWPERVAPAEAPIEPHQEDAGGGASA